MWDLIKWLPSDPAAIYQNQRSSNERSSNDAEAILDTTVCQPAHALARGVIGAFVAVLISMSSSWRAEGFPDLFMSIFAHAMQLSTGLLLSGA